MWKWILALAVVAGLFMALRTNVEDLWLRAGLAAAAGAVVGTALTLGARGKSRMD
jgi:hypothetical protein